MNDLPELDPKKDFRPAWHDPSKEFTSSLQAGFDESELEEEAGAVPPPRAKEPESLRRSLAERANQRLEQG